jgi:hypothetical protein
MKGIVLGMALALSACTHAISNDSPFVDRALAEKTLRIQLVERGAADKEFVHEILHELGQGPEGDRQLAQLLVEHLTHHPTTATAVFQELATQRIFQDWLIEQLRSPKKTREED